MGKRRSFGEGLAFAAGKMVVNTTCRVVGKKLKEHADNKNRIKDFEEKYKDAKYIYADYEVWVLV